MRARYIVLIFLLVVLFRYDSSHSEAAPIVANGFLLLLLSTKQWPSNQLYIRTPTTKNVPPLRPLRPFLRFHHWKEKRNKKQIPTIKNACPTISFYQFNCPNAIPSFPSPSEAFARAYFSCFLSFSPSLSPMNSWEMPLKGRWNFTEFLFCAQTAPGGRSFLSLKGKKESYSRRRFYFDDKSQFGSGERARECSNENRSRKKRDLYYNF